MAWQNRKEAVVARENERIDNKLKLCILIMCCGERKPGNDGSLWWLEKHWQYDALHVTAALKTCMIMTLLSNQYVSYQSNK